MRKLARVCKFHLGLNIIHITYFLKKKKIYKTFVKPINYAGRFFFFFYYYCLIIFYVRICILTGQVGHNAVQIVRNNSKLKHPFSKRKKYSIIYVWLFYYFEKYKFRTISFLIDKCDYFFFNCFCFYIQIIIKNTNRFFFYVYCTINKLINWSTYNFQKVCFECIRHLVFWFVFFFQQNIMYLL